MTEDFDRTIVLFKRKLGWRKSLAYESVNVTRRRPHATAVAPEVIEAIKAQNELDEALYTFVRERFDQQIHDAADEVNRDLRLLHLGNAVYRYGPRPALKWCRRVTRRFLRPIID